MPAWFSAYCTRSVAGILADEILAGIRDTDFWTVAEGFGIEDDEAVSSAVDALRIEPVGDQSDIRFRLSYRPPEFRPVLVHVWTDSERVRTELEEATERLEEAVGDGRDRVRSFERAKPNQLWQTDLFTFVLKRQTRRVYLVAFMDDHSRFVVR